MKIKKTPIAFAVSIALLTQYPPAWAADQAATSTPEASEAAKNAKLVAKEDALVTITVTASKRAEQAYKVPYNVSAISEETLRRENITDAKKLIADNVSISAPGNSARFTDSVTVR